MLLSFALYLSDPFLWKLIIVELKYLLALIKIYFSSNTKSFQILAEAIVNVQCSSHMTLQRRDYRYQRGNQNPYIEEQTTPLPKEKCTKGKTTIDKAYIWS